MTAEPTNQANQIRTQINVDLTNRDKQTALLRIFLVIPPLIFLITFSSNVNVGIFASVGGFLFFPSLLALVFRGVYPSYCLAYNKAYLSLSNRVTAYMLLLTDQYPSIEENSSVTLTYPEIDGGKKLSRGMPLVKWFLAIPLYVVGIIYAVVAFVLTFVAWINILLKGTYSEKTAEFVVNVIAFWNRVYGYAFMLVTDDYPSFVL